MIEESDFNDEMREWAAKMRGRAHKMLQDSNESLWDTESYREEITLEQIQTDTLEQDLMKMLGDEDAVNYYRES